MAKPTNSKLRARRRKPAKNPKGSLQRMVRRRLLSLRDLLESIDSLITHLLKAHQRSMYKVDWYRNLQRSAQELLSSDLLPKRPPVSPTRAHASHTTISKALGIKPMSKKAMQRVLRAGGAPQKP
jgi:hypothetical protein